MLVSVFKVKYDAIKLYLVLLMKNLIFALTIAIKYPAVRPASRRGLRFYIGSQLLEM
jgi:hypothetical protein